MIPRSGGAFLQSHLTRTPLRRRPQPSFIGIVYGTEIFLPPAPIGALVVTTKTLLCFEPSTHAPMFWIPRRLIERFPKFVLGLVPPFTPPASSPAPVSPFTPPTGSSAVPSAPPFVPSAPAARPVSPRPPATPPSPSPAVGDGGARRPVNPFLSKDPNQRAKRLARALVSDIITYHPAKHAEGLRDGTLKQLFREEIKKSFEEYIAQVGQQLAESTTYFQEALNEVLAAGKKIF